MSVNSNKRSDTSPEKRVVVRDRNGESLYEGDKVILYDYAHEDFPIHGVLVYDKAFWAHAVHTEHKRYLLLDNLRTIIDPGDGGFAYAEIEKDISSS